MSGSQARYVSTDSQQNEQRTSTSQGQPALLEAGLPQGAVLQRRSIDPGHLTPTDVLTLQRTVGNQAVARLLNQQSTPLSRPLHRRAPRTSQRAVTPVVQRSSVPAATVQRAMKRTAAASTQDNRNVLPRQPAKQSSTIQRNLFKNIGKGIATAVSGLAGGIGGAVTGLVGGAVGGLAGGAGVGATKTWKLLTKDKSNWHKLYAWLPTLLAGVGGGVAGAAGGAVAGLGAGAIGGATGLGGRVADELWSSSSNLGPIPKDPLLDPGIPGKFLGPSVIVNPDSEMVAQVTRGDRAMVYEIGSSPWAKVALGENGEGEQGFVDRRRVITVWSGGDTPWFQGRATHKDVAKQPLFKGTPSPDDIVQGSIGDCYLLAALSNIARVDPAFIKNKLIKDNGNGTVTARFYRSNGNTFTPEQVTVRKSLLTYNRSFALAGKVTNQKQVLWPGMVEKAYATWRKSQDLPSMVNTPGNYRKLEGGWGNEVFAALYGTGAHKESLEEGGPDIHSGFVYPWGVGAFGSMKSTYKPVFVAGIKNFLPDGANEQDNAQYMRWEKYAAKHYSEITDSYSAGDKGMQPTVPFVIQHLKKAGISEGRFFKAVVEYSRQFMGGEGRKGFYTPAALAAFNKIKHLTDTGQHITIGTRAWGDMNKVITGSGKTKSPSFGGILTVDDLFPSHAYEVVSTKTKGEVKFIKLRNPHGQKKVVGSGEFYIELSRAMRYLDSYHYLERDGEAQEENVET